MGIFSNSRSGMKAMLENSFVSSEAEKLALNGITKCETFHVGDEIEAIAMRAEDGINEAANAFLKDMGIMEYCIAAETGCEAEYGRLSKSEMIEVKALVEAEYKESCCKEGCCKESKCACGKCEACKAKAKKAVNEADDENTDSSEASGDAENKDSAESGDSKTVDPTDTSNKPEKTGSVKLGVYIKKVIDTIVNFFKGLKDKIVMTIAKIKAFNNAQKLAAAVKKAGDDKVKAVVDADGAFDAKIADIDKWKTLVDTGKIRSSLKTLADGTGEVEEKSKAAKELVIQAFGINDGVELTSDAIYASLTTGGSVKWSAELIAKTITKGVSAKRDAISGLNKAEDCIKEVLGGLQKKFYGDNIDPEEEEIKPDFANAQRTISELLKNYFAASSATAKAMCSFIATAAAYATKIAGETGSKDGESKDTEAKEPEKKEDEKKEDEKKDDEKKDETETTTEESFDFLGAFDDLF